MQRTKRKPETSEAPDSSKKPRRGLLNLTNFKSPLKKKSKSFNESSSTVKEAHQIATTKSCEASQIISQVPPTQFQFKSTDEDGIKMMRCIKKVLEDNFKSVSERLQLQSVPPCLYDLKNCHQFHSKKVELKVAATDSIYLAKNFLDEERHLQFVTYVRNSMCGRKEFPGVAVIRGVLDLMLVSRKSFEKLKIH